MKPEDRGFVSGFAVYLLPDLGKYIRLNEPISQVQVIIPLRNGTVRLSVETDAQLSV